MVYYISSSIESSLLRQSIRAHWEIENNLHHYLCVCWTRCLSQDSQEYSTDYGYYPKDLLVYHNEEFHVCRKNL